MMATAAVMKVLIHVRAGCWSRGAQRAHDLEAAICLLEVAGLHRGGDGIGTRPVEEGRFTERFRDRQRFGRVSHTLGQEGRNHDRITDQVQHTHHCGRVGDASGHSAGVVGQQFALIERHAARKLAAQGGEQQCAFGAVGFR